jgi:hypothetical protein
MMITSSIKYLKKFKRISNQNLINFHGWKTDKKYIIFESDDWGSIRMPSKEVYEKMLKIGEKVDEDPFTKYDSLESEKDLVCLFEVLNKYKDYIGKKPVITANFAVANPDFDKIKASDFQEYYYEPFTETYKKYSEHNHSFNLLHQGMEHKIFYPQLHCREHLNVTRWMKDLRLGKNDVTNAFNSQMISTGNSFTAANKFAYMDSFNYDTQEELNILKLILEEGYELFTLIMGYPSKSFVATCHIWSKDFEEEIAKIGVKYLQGSDVQLLPRLTEGTKTLGKKRHYIGQKNRYNQTYLMRNCNFEPSWNQKADWVSNCLGEISTAFKWKKPATISIHRLNFIGFIDEDNRNYNLRLFSELISKVIKHWPDIEFISSAELGDLMGEADCDGN